MIGATHIDGPGPPNINGPALIRAPAWPRRKLGAYHLYFSHHRGNAIRLAVSDALAGPWRVHPDPVLTIAETHYTDHIASPDVIADAEAHEVRMYFHGGHGTDLSEQTESLAVSEDGLRFRMKRRDIGVPYWRVFRHAERWYALVMPGTILCSADGLGGFELLADILPARTRHSAVAIVGSRALVFCSMIGDCPERILAGSIDLTHWRVSNLRTALAPAETYEGGHLPNLASTPGQCNAPARDLRDPAVYVEGDTLWLAYAAGGERCLALAAMPLPDDC